MRTHLIALLALVAAFASTSAHADNEGILFLGIRTQRGSATERANKAVLMRLERMGEKSVSPNKPLTAKDRNCIDQQCLAGLASDHLARWILGGDVTTLGPRNYVIKLWLFDVQSNQPLEEKEPCESCDDDALGNAISTTTGKLLEQRNTPAAAPNATNGVPESLTAPPPSTTISTLTSPPATILHSRPAESKVEQPELRGSRWPKMRVAAIALFGLAIIAAVASTAVLGTPDTLGQCSNNFTPPPGYECGRNREIGLGLSAFSAGLTIIGFGLTFGIP